MDPFFAHLSLLFLHLPTLSVKIPDYCDLKKWRPRESLATFSTYDLKDSVFKNKQTHIFRGKNKDKKLLKNCWHKYADR